MKKSRLLLLTFLLLGACQKPPHIQLPPPPVMLTEVQVEDIPAFIDTIGHFIAYNSVTVQAQVQGQLTGLFYQEGQLLNQGDLLFTIDSRPYQATLDKALGSLIQNQALFNYSKDKVARYAPLVQEEYVSQLDFDQYTYDMQSYQGAVDQSKADIYSAEINVGFCTIQSPITGICGKKLIDVGNIITDAGTDMLVINQISPLYVDFSIPERYFNEVLTLQRQKPLDIEIEIPNTPLRTTAVLEMIDNTVNAKTGQIALRGILPNEEMMFWPEQFVRVRLIMHRIPNSIMVPPEAVLEGIGGKMAWVVDKNNIATHRVIQVGIYYGGKVQVLSGLQPGDRVVTRGQLALRDGILVTVQNK